MIKYLILLFYGSLLFSQEIYEFYPPNQAHYIGGNVQFYKDFHQVLMDKKMEPCENVNESYSFRIVIYPDNKIKYVKEEDPINLEQNKCAFELTKEVAKYLTGWNPAFVEGKKVAALTSFWIIPNDLFGELKEGYDPIKEIKWATYEGGMNSFRKKVVQDIDLSHFTFNGKFALTVTFFIEKDGRMNEVKLAESSGLKEFDDMIIRRISGIRNKWTPATFHGVPIRYRFRLPLSFSME